MSFCQSLSTRYRTPGQHNPVSILLPPSARYTSTSPSRLARGCVPSTARDQFDLRVWQVPAEAAATRRCGKRGVNVRPVEDFNSPPCQAWTRSHTFAGHACRFPRTWCLLTRECGSSGRDTDQGSCWSTTKRRACAAEQRPARASPDASASEPARVVLCLGDASSSELGVTFCGVIVLHNGATPSPSLALRFKSKLNPLNP